MGSIHSTNQTDHSYEYSPPKTSHVRAFHSINDWKTYLDNIRGSYQLMVIDFTASWCAPCKFIEPAVTDLAAKFADVIFVKIDVDELMSVAREFGVEAMPTFVLVKHGKEVDKVVGAMKAELEKKIEKHRV
ncbi:hypothetical protein ACHQM5_006047 [Ranunculus cassubicifolius]